VIRSALPLVPLLAATLTALPPRASGQGFEGQITYNVSSQGQSMRMVHYLKDSSVRVELSLQGMSMVVLTDAEGTRQIMLMPETKQWVDVKAMNERMAAMMGGRMGRGGQPPQEPSGPVDIRPTGRTETVAGIECEHVLISADGTEVDVCAARGMGWYRAGAPEMGGPGGMGMGGRGMGMTGRGATGPSGISPAQMAILRERFADGFFPLKITSSQGGREAVMEVVALERGAVDDALFRPPPDYTEMRMPGGGD
jgi:hypothetical protein